MWRCSSQVAAMRPARTGPMPGTSVSRSGGAIFGGLELPAMFGIVAPPTVGEDGLSRLQIGQGADERDQPIVIHRGDRVTGTLLLSKAGHGEAVLRVLKCDPLD